MPNTDLTIKNIREEVQSALGFSGRAVELEESDVVKSLKDALRLYNRTRPLRRTEKIDATSSQKRYEIDKPGILGLVRFECVRFRITDGIDPFDPLSVIGPGGVHTGIDTFADYDQKLHYIEQARRISSAEVEWASQWEIDPTSGEQKLFLYADLPATLPAECSITYTFRVTPDDNQQTGMQHVPEGDVDWIIEFTTARVKQILAEIRGKFEGITGPDGSPLSVNYESLRSLGREDEVRLREDIKKRRRPLHPEIE